MMRPIIGDVQELTSTIRHVTRSEAERIKSEGRERVERIRKEAQERSEQARQEVLRRARAEAEQIRRRRRAQTVRQERESYLREREELLDEVWSRAEEKLRSVVEDEDTYSEVLHRLALKAAEVLGPGEVTLASEETGRRLLTDERLEGWSGEAGEAAGGTVTFVAAGEPLETWGGLVATVAETGRRVDATFPTRLELAREEMRDSVAKRMLES